MKGEINIMNVYEKIISLESKYNLIQHEISEVYWWRLIRLSVFKNILKKLNIWGASNVSEINNNLLNSVNLRLKYLYNSICKSCIYGNRKREILIFGHRRKKMLEGNYVDIHIYDLVNKLNENDRNYEIIDRPDNGKHFVPSDDRKSYIESFRFIKKDLCKLFFKHKILSEDNYNFIKNIEEKIYNIFNTNINLVKTVQKRIISFKVDYKFFLKLLTKRNPKKIYIVVSNVWHPLIAAAKKLNVKVIELQHGAIQKLHLAYNFPNCKISENEVPYFPDRFILYGKHWYENVDFPLPEYKITYKSPDILKQKIYSFKDTKKKKKQVVFISQGAIGKKLSKCAYLFAKKYTAYNIIYKLHPEEYNYWENTYLHLKKADRKNNFTVIDNNKTDLFEVLAESEFQVGVFSTAIYEGLVMNCKTVLIDLPGVELMEYLLKKNYAKLAKDHIELKNKLESINYRNIDLDYFYYGIKDI